jgi:hypothetical protein
LADVFSQRPVGLLLVDKRASLGFFPGEKIPLSVFFEDPLFIAKGVEL